MALIPWYRYYVLAKRKLIDYNTYLELYLTRRGYVLRCRDRYTGRFKKCPEIDRKTLVIRPIPVHNKYYGARLTVFGAKSILKEREGELEEMLIEFVENWLGYSVSDWWFAYSIEEEIVPWQYTNITVRDLFYSINEIEMVIENSEGEIVNEEYETIEIA